MAIQNTVFTLNKYNDAKTAMDIFPTATPISGGISTWGYGNHYGMPTGLGNGDNISRSNPTQVGANTTYLNIIASNYNMMAVKQDGTLWVSGRNSGFIYEQGSGWGQIGLATDWTEKISIGRKHGLGIKANGTLWSWGENNYGQLGDGTVINKSSPVQIGTGTTWLNISAGQYSTIATKTDGTLWLWGHNGYGQLGQGNIIARSSPVQVGAGTNWLKLGTYTNTHNVLAIKTDGTLWAWGANGAGQLGDGTIIHRSSPVQIGTGTNWADISTGNIQHTSATKTDGTLWSWGENNYGQLGDGTVINKSSPVQIGTGTTWSKVSCGGAHAIATKTNGTLWGWGCGGVDFVGFPGGMIGDNTVIAKSSPVQVGTQTNWGKISAGQWTSSAILNTTYTFTSRPTQKAIFGFGWNDNIGGNLSLTNLVSNTGVVGNDVTGVGSIRRNLAAAGYGGDKAIFGYGTIYSSPALSITNLVSNTGVVGTDVAGVGTARGFLAAAGYGGDKAIFGHGSASGSGSISPLKINLVSNTGVIATDTTGVGTSRFNLSAAGYGGDKAIFGFGHYSNGSGNITNLVSNTGVFSNDVTTANTSTRRWAAAAGFSLT